MTPIAWVLAVVAVAAAAAAAFLFRKWQGAVTDLRSAESRVHEAETELAKSESSEDLADRFKLISQEILDLQEEKAAKQVGSVVSPLREQVESFRKDVNEYLKEARSTKDVLNEKFGSMDRSVERLSDDARELTEALRGSSKDRGVWGETVLRKQLELAGLREGESFDLQRTFSEGDGRLRPDAVLMLPQGREIVIDAKVSLVGYLDYTAADSDDKRQDALKSLTRAVSDRVEEVAKYNSIEALNTPGFSFMFAPVESAWQLVASEKPDLIAEAQSKGVLVVGPTNMLAALKVVDEIWRSERKGQHLQEIFSQASKIMDACLRMNDNIDTLEKRIDSASKSVDDLRRSVSGRQGVIAHAKKLEGYGVKGKKELPAGLPDADDIEVVPDGGKEDEAADTAPEKAVAGK